MESKGDEKLYSFVEMMEYITSDKYKDISVYFTSVDNPEIEARRYSDENSIYFGDCSCNYDFPISCYLGKWRRIK